MAKYYVIEMFEDKLDGYRLYKVGDLYPRDGLEPTVERIKELMGLNSYGKVFLQKYTIGTGEPGAPKPLNLEAEMAIARNVHNTIDDRILYDMDNMKNWFDNTIANKDEVRQISAQLTQTEDYIDDMFSRIGSGRPSGFFQTLNDLISTYPSGNGDNFYVVNEDGYIYFWNGTVTEWQHGVKYQAPNLGMTKVINELEDSNMTDISNWVVTLANTVINDNVLTFTATSQYGSVGQYLPNIEEGHKYYISFEVNADNPNVAFDFYSTTIGQLTRVYHSGNGNYERLSDVVKIEQSANYRTRIIDYNSNNFTPVEFKKGILIDLTSAFGKGNEPNASELERLIKLDNQGEVYFENEINLEVIPVSRIFPKREVNLNPIAKVENGILTVVIPYNKNENLQIEFGKRGPNILPDFRRFTKVNKMTGEETLLRMVSSDFLAPYQVSAINNIDGDNTSSDFFTGGNHGFDNSGSISPENTPTARNNVIKYVIDGREVTEFNGEASMIDIYFENYIQANNTTKADGSGREVLKENYHIHSDGYKWYVENLIEALEEINISRYYGLQCQRRGWDGRTLYKGALNSSWQDGTVTSNSGDKNTDSVLMTKGNDYQEIFMERVGLGRLDRLIGRDYNAFSTASKTYFHLVEGDNIFNAGETAHYKGGYHFYSK